VAAAAQASVVVAVAVDSFMNLSNNYLQEILVLQLVVVAVENLVTIH
jgi:hypothetical protein